MTQAGQTMAVDWVGNVPSGDLAAMLGINQASDFAQFRAALAGWHAPTRNFVYAVRRLQKVAQSLDVIIRHRAFDL